jgi:hypothetical protein
MTINQNTNRSASQSRDAEGGVQTAQNASENTTASQEFVNPVYARMGSNPNMAGMSIAGRRALRDKMALARLEQKAGAPSGMLAAGGGGPQNINPVMDRRGYTPESVAAEQARSAAAQDPRNTGGFTYGGPRPGGMLPQGPMSDYDQGVAEGERNNERMKTGSDRSRGFMDAYRRRNSGGVGLGSNSLA